MISIEEVKKLADLARIEMGDEEIEKLRGEMDAILDYVGQIKSVTEDLGGNMNESKTNVFREDIDPTESETHSKEILAAFPQKEKNYLKVKKIL